MDAVEFLRGWKIMCNRNTDCINCPLYIEDSCMTGIPKYCIEKPEKVVELVENWSKTHPVFDLTEQQKTAIRGRIAEGYPWVVRDGNEYDCVWFFENEPNLKKSSEVYTDGGKCADVTSKVYDFVTFENSPLYLPDLLGGGENEKI